MRSSVDKRVTDTGPHDGAEKGLQVVGGGEEEEGNAAGDEGRKKMSASEKEGSQGGVRWKHRRRGRSDKNKNVRSHTAERTQKGKGQRERARAEGRVSGSAPDGKKQEGKRETREEHVSRVRATTVV